MKHLLLVFCHSVAFVFIFVLTSIGAYAQTSPVTVTITKVKAFIDEADEGLESLGEDTADLYAKVFINGVERSSFNVHQDDNYVGKYFDSFAEHYEIFGEHLADSKSYANYSGAKSALDAVGIDAMVKAFVESNVWGTPKRVLDKYEERRAIIGDFQAGVTFSFSGMSFDEVKSSMTIYATKVMPELRRWSKGDSKRRAA